MVLLSRQLRRLWM